MAGGNTAMKTATMAAAALLAAAAAAADSTALYRGGPARRGGTGEIPSEVEEVWRFKAGGPINRDPLAADGRIYVPAADGVLYCLDAETGKAAWKFDARYKDLGTPAIEGGKLFFSSSLREVSLSEEELLLEDRGLLYCLDAGTGKEVWKRRFPDRLLAPLAVSGGRIYLGRMDRRLDCLDAADGKRIWDFAVRGAIRSSPAPAGGTIVFGSEDGNVYCLDREGGRRIWKADLASAVAASPAVSGGRVFVGAADGTMHCLDLATGERLWRSKTGKTIAAAAALDGGLVVAGSRDGYLYCWNAADGARRWRFKAGDQVVGSACLAGGRVVAGSLDGSLHGVDAATGKGVWTFDAKGSLVASPVLSGEAIYIGTRDRLLYRLGRKSPSMRRTRGPAQMTDAGFAARLAAARAFNDAGRHGEAVEAARDLVAARPDSAPARLEFARGWDGAGEPGLAGREYGLAVQLEPRDAAYRNALGGHYARMGRTREALAQFQAAKQCAPSDPSAYLNTGKLMLTRGENESAEREFVLAMERGCAEGEGLACLAEAAVARLDFDRARLLLERLLAADPANPRARDLRERLRR